MAEKSGWRARVFRDSAPHSIAATAELEPLLADAYGIGVETWPEIDLAPETFVEYLAARVSPDGLEDAHIADLFLACACLQGDEAAIAELDREYLAKLGPALRPLGADGAVIDEVTQQLRATLLVGLADQPAKVASYSGRGRLASWIKTVAVRTALRELAKRGRARHRDRQLEDLADSADNPELEHLKNLYGNEFSEAFKTALDDLTDRERVILRQHHLDGLTVDELAGLYRIHRSTAARWAAAARHKVFEGTRRRLIDALDLSPSEVDSVIRLVRSQLDVSLSRFC